MDYFHLLGPVRAVTLEREIPRLTETAVFDLGGRMMEWSVRTPGGSFSKTVFSYDSAGRLVTRSLCHNGGPCLTTYFTFDPAGRPESSSVGFPDGKMWTFEQCYYGETGVAKKIQFADPGTGHFVGEEWDGVRFSYRDEATATTLYDEQERPREILCHDAEHTLLGRTLRVYDSAGRLKRETHQAEARAWKKSMSPISFVLCSDDVAAEFAGPRCTLALRAATCDRDDVFLR